MAKQVYRITWPNGKIYVGSDLTGSVSYFGSPTVKAEIEADLDNRLEYSVSKAILWESETATDSEVRAMELRLIVELGANDPARGYNRSPRFTG